MLDFGPYLRCAISTLGSIKSDPLEAWIRFHEQFSASREPDTPANLYVVQHDWEDELHR